MTKANVIAALVAFLALTVSATAQPNVGAGAAVFAAPPTILVLDKMSQLSLRLSLLQRRLGDTLYLRGVQKAAEAHSVKRLTLRTPPASPGELGS